MTINYTTLTGAKTVSGSLANFVNRSDLPTEAILAETQAWIYQRLRVREMITRGTLSFATTGNSVALPARFLDPISFTPYTWGEPLDLVDEANLMDFRDEDGDLYESTPSRWAIIGETAYVNSQPTETFAGILLYYAQPADLVATTNETNFLTTRYPRLLRHALMGIAFEHMKDTDRSAGYMQMAEADLQEAARTNDLFRRGQQVPRL